MSPLSCSAIPLTMPSKEEWIEKGRQEAQESLASFRNAHREQLRLLGHDLIESERRNAQSERRNNELKTEVKKKIVELSDILEELEESHPCAKPPVTQLRKIIEDLKQLEAK